MDAVVEVVVSDVTCWGQVFAGASKYLDLAWPGTPPNLAPRGEEKYCTIVTSQYSCRIHSLENIPSLSFRSQDGFFDGAAMACCIPCTDHDCGRHAATTCTNDPFDAHCKYAYN